MSGLQVVLSGKDTHKIQIFLNMLSKKGSTRRKNNYSLHLFAYFSAREGKKGMKLLETWKYNFNFAYRF